MISNIYIRLYDYWSILNLCIAAVLLGHITTSFGKYCLAYDTCFTKEERDERGITARICTTSSRPKIDTAECLQS